MTPCRSSSRAAGAYEAPGGRRIVLAADLLACVNNTQCYEPEALAGIRDRVLAQPVACAATIFEVANETTLQGSARLAVSEGDCRIGVLNFASARNPGGGFLAGAQAQEESLARSSGLYHSLLKCQSYYHYHRVHRSGLYSDRMIYSPRCPVFRRDDGVLLEAALLRRLHHGSGAQCRSRSAESTEPGRANRRRSQGARRKIARVGRPSPV